MNAGTLEKEKAPRRESNGAASEQSKGITYPTAAQLRKAAEDYMYRGWSPIPIAPAAMGDPGTGKAPTLKGWQSHYTALDELKKYWPDGTRNGIGITCGPSRLAVLDFDEATAYHAWAATHPDAAQSYTVARDNAEPGRCHVYFTLGDEQDAPLQLTKKAMGWGDLKTEGGQVVAPPSVHYSGGRYAVLNDAEPLPWRDEYTPAPWGDAAKPKPSTPRSNTPPPVNAGPGIPPSVQAAIDAGAPEGERNATAFMLACQLRDEGHAGGTARAILESYAARCRPPLSQSELGATVNSAYAAAPRDPARNPTKPRYEPHARATEQGPPAPTPADEWPDPEPLGALSGTPPAWPWEAFPRTLRRMGEEITATMNAPPELSGLAILCAASIACGKNALIEIKSGHTQFPNLYGMAGIPVGGTKTPATRPIIAPLIARQHDLRTEHKIAMREWMGRAKVARAQIAALEKEAGKGDRPAAEISAEIARLEAVESERPPEPILIVDNCTPEAMARILSTNGGKLGAFSADGRDIMAIAQGRYSKGTDIGLWLKGHGNDYFAYNRSNPDKPPFECVAPALSAFIAIQPDALIDLGASKTLRESGFLARWLYVLPECTPGEYPEACIDPLTIREYGRTVARILDMKPGADADGHPAPHICRLDPDAFSMWKAYHDTTKRAAAAAQPLMGQCLIKMTDHLARIALVFHLAECAERSTAPGTITAAEMGRAATLADCLKAHMGRAVELLGESIARAKARELLPIIQKNRDTLRERRAAEGLGDLCAVKPRDIVRGTWAGIQSTDEARAALEMLDVKGWVRLRTVEAKGARDHELYEVHPKL